MKKEICRIWVTHKEDEYYYIFEKNMNNKEYINNLFWDIIKFKKDELFDILKLPKYFTIWDGYLETPISWDPVTGNRWIADINNKEDKDYNIYNWILDNEDYLWDIFQYHVLDRFK